MPVTAVDLADPRLPRIVRRRSAALGPLRARIAELTALVEERDEIIARLKGPVDRLVAAAPVLGLTPLQAEFLALLFAGDMVTPERVETALHGLSDRVPDRTVYKVMIHHMRRRLGFLGVEIETIPARGWRLDARSKGAIVAHLERAGRW